MEMYDYWITVYSVVFTVLTISLSLNSIFFIKDKINKILAFFSFAGLYAFILSYFFEKASVGYAEQDPLYTLIYEGYRGNIFHGTLYLLFALFCLIVLIVRLVIKK